MSKLNINKGIKRVLSLSMVLMTLGGCNSYTGSNSKIDDNDDLVSSLSSDSSADCSFKPYCWPIENVTSNENIQIVSNFGYNNATYDESSKMIIDNYHRGIDLISQNVNVIAVNDGIVINATLDQNNNKSGYGNYVVIKHNDGNYTLYSHLQEGSITVTKGDAVCQGQIIGKIGQTGNAFAPHLHFELREGANSCYSTVDPLDYINNNKVKAK